MIRRLALSIVILTFLLILLPGASQAKIIHIAVGDCVLALDDTGHVWAWGGNQNGDLGIGTLGGSYGPDNAQQVQIDDVKAIATDGMCCFALKNDGTVWAWGYGGEGRLGYGGSDTQPAPVQVKGLTDIVAISTSGLSSFALKKDGTVYAWGLNKNGELGGTYGAPEYVDTPIQVNGLADIVALGDHGNYAIKRDGTVYAWGDNTLDKNPETGNVTYGFLGDPAGPGERPIPFQVLGVSNAKQITNSGYFTLYLKNDGTVWGWGFNQFGELGDGTKYIFPVYTDANGKKMTNFDWVCTLPPVQAKIVNVKQISATSAYSTVTALKEDGTVWEWGLCTEASGGGSPGPALSPVQMRGIDHVIEVRTSYATIVLKDDGSVWGWGVNSNNLLKDGKTDITVTSPLLLFEEPGVEATTTSFPTSTGTPPLSSISEPSILPSPTPSGSVQAVVTPSPVTDTQTTKATHPSSEATDQLRITATSTPIPLSSVMPSPATGFSTAAMLSCLLITAGLLSGFVRRKDR